MKKNNIIIIVIIISVIVINFMLMSCTDTTEKVKENLELGNKHLNEGKYEEAILAFEKVIKIEPKNIEVRISLANAYVIIGKPEQAKKVLEEAIEIDSNQIVENEKLSKIFFKNLAKVYKETNEYEKAIESSLKLIEIEEKNIDAYLMLSDIYINLEDFEKALKILKEGYEKTKSEEIIRTLSEINVQYPEKVPLRKGQQIVSIESVSSSNEIIIKDYFKIVDEDESSGAYIYEPDTQPNDLKVLKLSENVVIQVMKYNESTGQMGSQITLDEFRKYINMKEFRNYSPALEYAEFVINIENGIVTRISEMYQP